MDEITYIDQAKTFIEKNTNLKIEKVDRDWLKVLGSNIRIHVNWSKEYQVNSNNLFYGWFNLSATTYNYFLNDNYNIKFNLIVLGDIDTVFIIPRSDIIKIFDKKFMTKPHEWIFNIFKKDEKYTLEFANWSDQFDITNYLNNLGLIKQEIDNMENGRYSYGNKKWDDDSIVIANKSKRDKINKLGPYDEPKYIKTTNMPRNQERKPLLSDALRLNVRSDDRYPNKVKNESKIILTGYSIQDLELSISHKILGWKDEYDILNRGDYVFVYNNDTNSIQTAFILVEKTQEKKLIWEEESNTKRVVFQNRWNVEIITNDLHIGLNLINNFEPFKENSQRFMALVNSSHPSLLSYQEYGRFCNFLMKSLNPNNLIGRKKLQKSYLEITYWQIEPGEKPSQWNEQLENRVIALGIDQIGDLSNRTIDDIIYEIENNWSSSDEEVKQIIVNFLSFKKGDRIIANNGPTKVIGIGEVIGDYKYRPELTFSHTYPVRWLDMTETEIRPNILMSEKIISKLSQQAYEEISNQINTSAYLLIRHQPNFKRTKSERKYWHDLLGKEYHFGKNVVNSSKMQKGTRTIWFYTNDNKLYLWGHGDVSSIGVTNKDNEDLIAGFSNFIFYDVDKYSAIKLDTSMYDKIKNLESWNPDNSIIQINKEIFDEIVLNPLQLNKFNDEPLPIPNDQIEDGYEKITQMLLIPKNKVIEILTALTSGRHVLLAGPIGTGKTKLASLIPEIFWKEFGGYRTKIYTANSDWATQDVIGGIYPKVEDKRVIYDIQYGCVVETIAENWENNINGGSRIQIKSRDRSLPYRGVWLVIDEFNRADIDKAFGQLFTALRTRVLKIPIQSSNTIEDINSSHMDLRIPQDYRIIGTLNTADKHFLFQLSDALKSRFAYIEIDMPHRNEFETEIYYAMKNAIEEMDLEKERYEAFVIIDENNKKVIPGKTVPNFFDITLQAYYYLDCVRIFKKLGTGILQLIYQNMLAGMLITGDARSSLDNALTSTLISQLENLPIPSLGVLKIFCNGNAKQTIVEYFKEGCRNHNRHSFVESFGKVLVYIGLEDSNNNLGEKFSNGILINDLAFWTRMEDLYKNNNFWTRMEDLYKNNKIKDNLINFQTDLEHFKQGIADLIKSVVI